MANSTTYTPTAAANTTTSSPVGIMDWQSKLSQGNTNAVTRDVNKNETVSNQLTDLTASNSKYIQQARDSAANKASASGMLTSSLAAGNAERAAIDAGLPIAQQDASTYSRVASENMSAQNADNLADQNMFGTLTGQQMGIQANLDEAERARKQAQIEREATQKFQTGEREAQQGWQTGERLGQQDFTANQTLTQQNYEAAQKALDRTFTGTQNEKQLAQQRFEMFNQAMVANNANLSQTLAAIYSNTALKASEQAAAAANARSVYTSLLNSYASTMSGGVPQIFWSPYEQQATANTAPTSSPATAPAGTGSYGSTYNPGNPSGGFMGNVPRGGSRPYNVAQMAM